MRTSPTERGNFDSKGSARRILYAAEAAIIAAVLTALLVRLLPHQLNVSTDVVGFPIHSNFNVTRYFYVFYLATVFFPLLTMVLYALIQRVRPDTPGQSVEPRRSHRPPLAPRLVLPKELVGQLTRMMLVGATLGMGFAIQRDWKGTSTVWSLAFVAFGYTSVLLLGIGVTRRRGSSTCETVARLAMVNALVAPLAVLWLVPMSRATRVFIQSTGTIRHYPWAPPVGTAVLSVILLVVVIILLARMGITDATRVERPIVLTITGSLVIFFLMSRLPGTLGSLDPFHEGEGLVAAHWIGDLFPWRDLMFTHGIWEDVVRQAIGLHLFEDSRWGAGAGVSLLAVPLYWIGWYLAAVYLFRRNWAALLLFIALVTTEAEKHAHVRITLLPYALLLFIALLRKPTVFRTVLFVGILLIFGVSTPEAAPIVASLLLGIVTYELVNRAPGSTLRSSFRRTRLCLASGTVLSGVLAAYLMSKGALDDFAYYYRTFTPGHHLTGGIPLDWEHADLEFRIAVVVPPILVIAGIWYVASRRRRLRDIPVDEWAMLFLLLAVFLYYPKFLSRADAHVFQVFALAFPLVLYVSCRLLEIFENGLLSTRWGELIGRVTTPRLITILTAFIVCAIAPISPLQLFEGFTQNVRVMVKDAPTFQAMGYTGKEEANSILVSDLGKVLHAYLQPGDTLFDFSNNPALFHYLLDVQPSTRYYHVSMAIRQSTQRDLVNRLRKAIPRLVVFHSDRSGLPSWDGIPNMVRHYDVSQYLLNHYRPLFKVQGYLFLWRKDLGAPPINPGTLQLQGQIETADLLFEPGVCAWGYAPGFMPAPNQQRSVPVRTHKMAAVQLQGWALDQTGQPVKEVVTTLDGTIIGRVTPDLSRPDVAALLGPRGARSGYTMTVELNDPEANTKRLRVFGISKSGTASELHYHRAVGQTPLPSLSVLPVNGLELPVISDAVQGWVDRAHSKMLIQLDLPDNQPARRYNWIEVETNHTFLDTGFTLTDQLEDPTHAITFRTRKGDRSPYRVHVGSCSQWHGYERRTLFLTSDRTLDIAAVHLVSAR